MDGSVSKSDFARIYGCDPSYVTKLVKTGKAVTSTDGKRILVEPTLRLIEATRDLSKQGVRERWAAYRAGARLDQPDAAAAVTRVDGAAQEAASDPSAPLAAAIAASAAGAASPPPVQASAPPSEASAPNARRSDFQLAQADLTRAQAELKKLELRQLAGELVESVAVLKAIADFGIALRDAMLGRPDRLAMQLAAETDARRVHALLLADDERTVATFAASVDALRRRLPPGAAAAAEPA